MLDLLYWLETELGYDAAVKARKNLYRKLVRVARHHGDAALRVIAACWHDAQEFADGKPGLTIEEARVRWFCRAVKIRLRQRGLWDEPNPFAELSGDALALAGFKVTKPLALYPDQQNHENTDPQEVTRDDYAHKISEMCRRNGLPLPGPDGMPQRK